MTSAIAAAIALTVRALTPTRSAVSGSSDVARIARPSDVWVRKQLQAAEHRDRGGEDQHRELADRDVVGELHESKERSPI